LFLSGGLAADIQRRNWRGGQVGSGRILGAGLLRVADRTIRRAGTRLAREPVRRVGTGVAEKQS
jgi:hypothetical protein